MARNNKGQFAGKTLESDTLGLMTSHGKTHLQGLMTRYADLFEELNAIRPLDIIREFCESEGIPYDGANYLESVSAQYPHLAHIVGLAKFQQDLRQAARKMYQVKDVMEQVA